MTLLRRPRPSSLALFVATAAAGLGLGGAAPAHAPPSTQTLTVFAAASLTESFKELGATLHAKTPGSSVVFNFAGSQQLALQLEQGAPADVFASADDRWMNYVKEKDLIEGDPRLFVRNRLVVIVPKTNPARIRALPDLARHGTKVVLAADAVPVGKYSREALRNLASAPGFPAEYDAKVVANVVSQEDNVKAVVSKVQLGEADAGIVYRSDVTPAVSRYVRAFDIPDQYNVIATYPIAQVKASKNAEAAQVFIALVLSDEGQAVLQRHGFLPAMSTSAPPSP